MRAIILVSATILFLYTSNVSAQNKTYIGFEAAVTGDIYRITDNGNNLKTVPLVNGLWGFNVRQDLNQYLFVETGLIRKYYDEGFGFKTMDSWGTSDAIYAWFIPLRLGTKVNLYKETLYLVPVIGYSFCINSDYGYGSSGWGRGSARSSTNSVSYRYTENIDLHQYFSLLQTGLGLECTLFKFLIVSVSANYYTGFTNIIELDIQYSSDNSAITTGKAFSKGDFWNVGAGLKYPISNFWMK